MTYLADPFVVACRYCRAAAGSPCRTWDLRPAARPHKARIRHAYVVLAHSDPLLGELFPPRGPCWVCGASGLDARHRVIDSVAGQLEAGEDPAVVADELELTAEQVGAVAEWSQRWPRAWQ